MFANIIANIAIHAAVQYIYLDNARAQEPVPVMHSLASV